MNEITKHNYSMEMDKSRLMHLIENDYNLLKKYEHGDCYGANGRQLQPSITSFVAVARRFYTNVDLLGQERVFSPSELFRIGGCISAVDRESQNKDVEVVMRVLMYDVEDVMRIVKSKQYDNE